MSAAVVLDSTPLGILCHPRTPPHVRTCRQWVKDLLAAGRRVIVPEIADYEVRWGPSLAESALGAYLLGQKKHAEAEPLLLQGYEGLRQHEERLPAGSRRTWLTEALERLVQLYDASDKPAEAAKWRSEFQARKEGAKKL